MTVEKTPRKISRKSLVRQADKAFGDYIKARDNHVCVTCGEINREMMDCGHLFSRVAYSTRWDERNAFAQCRSCNLTHEYDPGPLTLVFLNKFGQGEYDLLHRTYRTPEKYKDADLQEIIAVYRRLLTELVASEGENA